ncbi:hypothetical protein QTV49_000453 [Vibrio vulnificus]|nr:hypothetical protein [Vibrio vulnificus]
MANSLNKIKSALVMVCFFLTPQTLADYGDISPSFSANSHARVMSGKPIEFETFLVRYATHYPTGSFAHTVNITSASIKRFCNEFELIGNSCLTDLQQNSIEGLIQITTHLKEGLSEESGLPLEFVDKTLLKVAIDNVNDPYTIMLKPNQVQEAAKKTSVQGEKRSTISKDDKLLTIVDFDSEKGCYALSLTSKPENVLEMDLRDNIGGDLECTLKVLSEFLPIGRHHVATLFTINGEEEIWIDGRLPLNQIATNKNLIVNKNTASSAEIFAKNLIGSGWGVSGLPMRGKRSIQAKFDTPYGSYLLTIGKFEISE